MFREMRNFASMKLGTVWMFQNIDRGTVETFWEKQTDVLFFLRYSTVHIILYDRNKKKFSGDIQAMNGEEKMCKVQ